MKERDSRQPEFKRTRATDTTRLLSSDHAKLAEFIGITEPGIQVEIYPATSEIDRKVAASALALDRELTDPELRGNDAAWNWYRTGLDGMEKGFVVTRIITEQQPGEKEPNPNRFWNTFNKLKHRQ